MKARHKSVGNKEFCENDTCLSEKRVNSFLTKNKRWKINFYIKVWNVSKTKIGFFLWINEENCFYDNKQENRKTFLFDKRCNFKEIILYFKFNNNK